LLDAVALKLLYNAGAAAARKIPMINSATIISMSVNPSSRWDWRALPTPGASERGWRCLRNVAFYGLLRLATRISTVAG
jgi:hypothetical protein